MSFSYVTISLFLIAFLFPDITNAQGIDVGIVAPGTQFCLQLENKTTHKVIFLVEGEILGYKLRSAKRFVSGRITAITDTTITLEDRETGSNTLSLKELTALKVQKSSRKKTLGNILIVVGAWILVGVTANPAEGTSTFLNYLAYPIGLAAVIKGYSILAPQKIILNDSWTWTFKELKMIETIERGNFIRIVLKNGGTVEEMKVDKINSELIKGMEISQDSHEQFVYTSRTIGVGEIKSVTVRKK